MPAVSIIIPCLNEEKRIYPLLQALCRQTYPLEEMEVVIADGMSTDQTRAEIDRFKYENLQRLHLQVVNNPLRHIPVALNLAIKQASGDFIIRMDAHSIPNQDYVERCVAALRDGKAENVGGIWLVMPGDDSVMAAGIALAAQHPVGVGDALYRVKPPAPVFVDTVPFGSYRRELLVAMGGYDENLASNEDYELNARIRKAGGRILLDPEIVTTYFARTNLKSLSKQYWRYGYWKLHMLKKYPETIRLRQAAPPVFILSISALILASLLNARYWSLLMAEMALYILVITGLTFKTAITRRIPIKVWFAMILSIMTMHFSWGSAFLWGLLKTLFTKDHKRNEAKH